MPFETPNGRTQRPPTTASSAHRTAARHHKAMTSRVAAHSSLSDACRAKLTESPRTTPVSISTTGATPASLGHRRRCEPQGRPGGHGSRPDHLTLDRDGHLLPGLGEAIAVAFDEGWAAAQAAVGVA